MDIIYIPSSSPELMKYIFFKNQEARQQNTDKRKTKRINKSPKLMPGV